MSTESPIENEDVHDAASAWLIKRDAGFSPGQSAAFARWRAADGRHEAAFVRLEGTRQLLTQLPQSPAAQAMLKDLEQLYDSRRRTNFPVRRIAAWMAIAACITCVFWFSRSGEIPPTTYVTTSQTQSVDLSDGSTLVLNRGSEVVVKFQATERRLELQRGEAHFSVAKDPTRPFYVTIGEVTVRAVGTAFNIRRDADRVEVIVTEGKVQLTRQNQAGLPERDHAAHYLVAGEQAIIDLTNSLTSRAVSIAATGEETHSKLAWQVPRLEFSNTPLTEVVARFNRYSRMQLEIADPELGARLVGGNFDANNAESFVNLLIAGGDVRVERLSETHLVLHQVR